MSAELDLDPVKQRADAATEGPWQWDEPTDDSFPQSEENLWTVNPRADGYPDCVVGSWGYDADGIDASPEDRAFIAHARTDIPALIAEVERLRGILDRVREATTTARHALHLTGTLDAREVLQHITTAMETE